MWGRIKLASEFLAKFKARRHWHNGKIPKEKEVCPKKFLPKIPSKYKSNMRPSQTWKTIGHLVIMNNFEKAAWYKIQPIMIK